MIQKRNIKDMTRPPRKVVFGGVLFGQFFFVNLSLFSEKIWYRTIVRVQTMI